MTKYLRWARQHAEDLERFGMTFAPDWLTEAMLADPQFDHDKGWEALDRTWRPRD